MVDPTQWRNSRGVACALTFLAALSAFIDCRAADAKPAKVQRTVAPEYVFTNTQILRIQIEIPEQGIATLRETSQSPWGEQAKRPSVKAVVREGGKTYADVAIHLKGAAGSFRSVDDRPGLTLNFDKHVKGQTFHGIERFSLNNSVQDQSLLSEVICRELFLAAGVPVPRATHAKVELNGRDLGVYVLAEAFNKQFLAAHFESPDGNLYDGGFLKDITDNLEKSSGGNPEDRSDLKRLAEAAMEPNGSNRWERLHAVLDVERFVTYLALDILLCDWDGYGLKNNNYRIYHDPVTDKIVFMPHGLDQMFGVMLTTPEMPIFPRMSGLVARAVMQSPPGRLRYHQRLSDLMGSVYNVNAMTNRVWQLASRIRPILAEKGPGAVRSHEGHVADLCDRISKRALSVQGQLAEPDVTLKFDAAGVARLAEWQSRADHGKPVLEEVKEGGKRLFHVSAKDGSCVGAWVAQVQLKPGDYRLEGRIKSRGVVIDPGDRRGGAAMRIQKRWFPQKLTGDADWTDIGVDFQIQDIKPEFAFMAPIQPDTPEVEVICELRAAKGEAWFDAESIRLLRR